MNKEAVVSSAQELIARHPHFRGRAGMFELECRENVLVIRGRVPTFYLKQLLQNTLMQLEGVQRVDNRVDVYALDGVEAESR